jgi:hypothetical protein
MKESFWLTAKGEFAWNRPYFFVPLQRQSEMMTARQETPATK